MDFSPALILALTLATTVTSQTTQTLKLNGDTYIVDWTLSADNKSISFKVDAESEGWIGIGFSPKGDMYGADLVVATVRTETTMTVKSYWSHGVGRPTVDTKQDLTEITQYRIPGTGGSPSKVHLEFTRLLNTGNSQDIVLPLNGIRVIWALSPLWKFEKHTNRGSSKKVKFDPLAPEPRDGGVSGTHGISLVVPAIAIYHLHRYFP